jgi:hypothetical protein
VSKISGPETFHQLYDKGELIWHYKITEVSDGCLLQRTRSRSNSSQSIYTSFRIHEEPAQSFRPTGYRDESKTARVYISCSGFDSIIRSQAFNRVATRSARMRTNVQMATLDKKAVSERTSSSTKVSGNLLSHPSDMETVDW